MKEKETKTPINRVKLNYMPAKEKVSVSSARMEELDRAIREKHSRIKTNLIWLGISLKIRLLNKYRENLLY